MKLETYPMEGDLALERRLWGEGDMRDKRTKVIIS